MPEDHGAAIRAGLLYIEILQVRQRIHGLGGRVHGVEVRDAVGAAIGCEKHFAAGLVQEVEALGGLVPQEVRKEDIAEVVARRARIPVARLFESERERMLKLEERILGRDQRGNVMVDPPIIETITEDGVLADAKLIAEPWDAAGLYQVGRFPFGRRWSEWNGRYRDDVRRFWRGEAGLAGAFASRLTARSCSSRRVEIPSRCTSPTPRRST